MTILLIVLAGLALGVAVFTLYLVLGPLTSRLGSAEQRLNVAASRRTGIAIEFRSLTDRHATKLVELEEWRIATVRDLESASEEQAKLAERVTWTEKEIGLALERLDRLSSAAPPDPEPSDVNDFYVFWQILSGYVLMTWAATRHPSYAPTDEDLRIRIEALQGRLKGMTRVVAGKAPGEPVAEEAPAEEKAEEGDPS